ncbi:MAG: primosomal protein N', partial [Nitrospinae bacterium RIFCSPLOWO2_12_FULL_47_7]
ANYIFCKECGFVFHCPRCSVTLTFHENDRLLQCHYCNFKTGIPQTCADCSSEVIRFNGFGTQKLEGDIRQAFPQARVARLDRDTTRTHDDFASLYQQMTDGDIDIMIGTQMITKGHDFPNVTLVGVVHADLSLNIPDFRSSERSFQLLTQVAGRAGRGDIPGQVIIQTHNPDHYVFNFVCNHDYEEFYKTEIQFRKRLNYPPFTRMVSLEIESENESLAEQLAQKLKKMLSGKITRKSGIELLGPSRAALYRINNKFRQHIILRSSDVHALQLILKQCGSAPEWQQFSSGKAKLIIDVDPVNLM